MQVAEAQRVLALNQRSSCGSGRSLSAGAEAAPGKKRPLACKSSDYTCFQGFVGSSALVVSVSPLTSLLAELPGQMACRCRTELIVISSFMTLDCQF